MRALLNIDEAAEALQCGRTSIYKFTRTGKLGHVKIGRSLRFTEKHLEDFIVKNSTEATRRRKSKTDSTEATHRHKSKTDNSADLTTIANKLDQTNKLLKELLRSHARLEGALSK